MHQVKLSALELTVELENNQRIVDHEQVDDMVEHTRKFLRERGVPHDDDYIRNVFGLKEYWWNPASKGGGNYITETVEDATTKYLRYVSTGNQDEDLFIRGHEETHVLEDYGKLEVLRREVQRVVGIDVNLTDYHGETIGNVRGILALRKAGKSDKDIKAILTSMNITNGVQYKKEALDVLRIS